MIAGVIFGVVFLLVVGLKLHPVMVIGGFAGLLGTVIVVAFLKGRERRPPVGPIIYHSPQTVPTAIIMPRPSVSFAEELRKMDWYKFEKIVALAYRKAGYKVELRGGANPDGGLDLVLTDSASERIGVQCKHWKSSNVGVKIVRELLGALQIAGLNRGILITMQGYTSEAKSIADRYRIQLVNESGLQQLVERADIKYDPQFISVLKDSRKMCPKCDHEMVLRTTKNGANIGRKFWGCSTVPACRYTMEMLQT